MDETEFRILDTLSRDPDRQVSISELTREIRHLHGTAYYPNTHRSLHEMKEEGIVDLSRSGSASIVSLNLRTPQTIDSLAEMELHKKHSLMAKREGFQRFTSSISDATSVGPLSLIDPERNMKLNRAEILLQLPDWASTKGTPEALRENLQELAAKLDMRIDVLALPETEFRLLLASRDRNPLKEMLSKQTTILGPDLFWSRIRNAWAHGIQIHFDRDDTNPTRISDRDLLHNLARFGYQEFGPQLRDGHDIGIEYIVTALLLKGEPRRIEAIPIILAKNPANYGLLLFLARKHGIQAELLGLLRTLSKHRPDSALSDAIGVLDKTAEGEASVDDRSIERKLRTYDVIK